MRGSRLDIVIADILTYVEGLEQDESLFLDESYAARVQALDDLELYFLGALDDNGQTSQNPGMLEALRRRALALHNRLVAMNESLLHDLRERIRAREYDLASLRDQIESYAGRGLDDDTQAGPGYDALDALVSDLLLRDPVSTSSLPLEEEMISYQPTPARIVLDVIDHASLKETDVFYDLGSGLGQVVILVCLLSGALAKGIERDPAYCAYARSCARALGLDGVQFIVADARNADYDDGTVFFLYSPFEGHMLQAVLSRLETEAHSREIRIYSYGPCTPDVAAQRWLEPIGQAEADPQSLAAFRGVPGVR